LGEGESVSRWLVSTVVRHLVVIFRCKPADNKFNLQ
jgi:hypothetical protein